MVQYLVEQATEEEIELVRFSTTSVWHFAASCYEQGKLKNLLPFLAQHFPLDTHSFDLGLSAYFQEACDRANYAVARFLSHRVILSSQLNASTSIFDGKNLLAAAIGGLRDQTAKIPFRYSNSAHWRRTWRADRRATIRTLVDGGVNVHTYTPANPSPHDWTPLHEAADVGDHEMARILAEAGADVNAKDRHSSSPLMVATKKGPYRNHPNVSRARSSD